MLIQARISRRGFSLRFLLVASFLFLSIGLSAHLVEMPDTLILDGEYISIERDTNEIGDNLEADSLSLPADSKIESSRFQTYLSVSPQFSLIQPEFTDHPEGYVSLYDWLQLNPLSSLMSSRSTGVNFSVFGESIMAEKRKFILSYRVGAGVGWNQFLLPVAFADESELLQNDSILDFRMDGDDLFMAYYIPFDNGVGEADSVFVKWRRDALKSSFMNGVVSFGAGLRPRNSPWQMGIDLFVGIQGKLNNNSTYRVGWVSQKSGYYETTVNSDIVFNRLYTMLQLRVERVFSGISKGFFQNSQWGLNAFISGRQMLAFESFTAQFKQLGIRATFTVNL